MPVIEAFEAVLILCSPPRVPIQKTAHARGCMGGGRLDRAGRIIWLPSITESVRESAGYPGANDNRRELELALVPTWIRGGTGIVDEPV